MYMYIYIYNTDIIQIYQSNSHNLPVCEKQLISNATGFAAPGPESGALWNGCDLRSSLRC